MNDVVFNQNFFDDLIELILSILNFIRGNWIWALILSALLIGLVFFQQVILAFFLHIL